MVTYRGHVSHYESEHWKRGGITAFMPPVCERQRFVIYVGLGVEKRSQAFFRSLMACSMAGAKNAIFYRICHLDGIYD